jgi:response regulator RpfG family c-di-GMP phosphodiesterase
MLSQVPTRRSRPIDGLIAEEHPLGVRFTAGVNAYRALTYDHPDTSVQSHDEVPAASRPSAGSQFDPRVVSVFCQRVPDTGTPVR